MKTRSLHTRRPTAKVHDLGRMGLRELVPAFFSYPAVRVYIALTLVSAAAAAWLGALAIPLRTALAAASAVIMYPVIWYLLHRFVLHSRLLYRFPATARLWKRIHYDHHQDPNRLDVLFGSLTNTLPTMVVATMPVGFWIAGNWSGAFSALGAALVTTCVYEYCHCIQHLNFQPKSAWLIRIKKLHMAHHFHNENGNYGIVSFWVDGLFGTRYDEIADVPRSPTVRNLGYDAAEAERYPWVAALSQGRRDRRAAPTAAE